MWWNFHLHLQIPFIPFIIPFYWILYYIYYIILIYLLYYDIIYYFIIYDFGLIWFIFLIFIKFYLITYSKSQLNLFPPPVCNFLWCNFPPPLLSSSTWRTNPAWIRSWRTWTWTRTPRSVLGRRCCWSPASPAPPTSTCTRWRITSTTSTSTTTEAPDQNPPFLWEILELGKESLWSGIQPNPTPTFILLVLRVWWIFGGK